MDDRTTATPRHILSIDFEEWFQVNSFAGIWTVNDWDRLECRLPAQTEVLLETLARTRTTATFFVVGWTARRFPGLIRRIATHGHEIASHSDEHMPLPDMGPEKFRQDIRASKKVLEDIAGTRIIGFRAPNWSLSEDAGWAVAILEEEGFLYDSSIFPIALRYGRKDAPRFPYRLGERLHEFPLSTLPLGGVNIPVGGGIFFRVEPLWLTRLVIRHYQRHKQPFVLYLHPWEIDPDHPRVRVPPAKRFIHYHNLDKTLGRLRSLTERFDFTDFRHFLGSVDP